MVKLTMCRKMTSKEEVVQSREIVMTKVKRMQAAVVDPNLMARRVFNAIFVTSMVT